MYHGTFSSFTSGTFISDAENSIFKLVPARTEKLNVLVVFPGRLPTLAIKEAFYKNAEH